MKIYKCRSVKVQIFIAEQNVRAYRKLNIYYIFKVKLIKIV